MTTTPLAERRKSNGDHAIRIALLEQGMENLAIELRGINGNISKLIWIAITAMGLAIARFIVSGGLSI